MDDVKKKVIKAFSSGQVDMNDTRPELERALKKKNVDLL